MQEQSILEAYPSWLSCHQVRLSLWLHTSLLDAAVLGQEVLLVSPLDSDPSNLELAVPVVYPAAAWSTL